MVRTQTNPISYSSNIAVEHLDAEYREQLEGKTWEQLDRAYLVKDADRNDRG